MFLIFFFSIALVTPEIFFQEEFDYSWRSRWVESAAHESEDKRGKWGWEAPKKTYHKEKSKGLKTLQDSKFYHISADIGKTISNENQTLIFSYTACNTQTNLKCAGSYIKLLPEKLNQDLFSADDHFYIMMGPDYCGSMNDRVNCILRKGGKEYQMRDHVHTKRDSNTHLYTLILYPDFTFEFHIDNNVEKSGNMQDQWNYFLPKFIPDPNSRKPDDWDEREEIEDPSDFKPDDWDQPYSVFDPKSIRPDDWDDEIDGKWIAPKIRNPAFKGEWKRKVIKNPKYNGTWEAPVVRNPKVTKEVEKKYAFKRIRYIGIDVWNVESGTIYDNIFLGNNVAEYKAFVQNTWVKQNQADTGKLGTDEAQEKLDKAKKKKSDDDDDDDDFL